MGDTFGQEARTPGDQQIGCGVEARIVGSGYVKANAVAPSGHQHTIRVDRDPRRIRERPAPVDIKVCRPVFRYKYPQARLRALAGSSSAPA
jgi:hypothetical protein